MEHQHTCIVRMATSGDHSYAAEIAREMAYSSARRGTGITHRTPEYIVQKMEEGLAAIAVNTSNGTWTGFCYLEVWQHQKYVANSGLIVAPGYRGTGISKEIKLALFDHCRLAFPEARLFSLSTSPAVMHVNEALGYKVVPFAEVMRDELFLTGCQSWVNYSDIMNRQQTHLPYVAMVYDPVTEPFKPALFHPSPYVLKKDPMLL